MKIAAVEAWVEAPLRRFVDDARARLALLLHPSGQVLAQAGFTRRRASADPAHDTASAAAITTARLGSQWPDRSRKFSILAGCAMPEMSSPRPNTIPQNAAETIAAISASHHVTGDEHHDDGGRHEGERCHNGARR